MQLSSVDSDPFAGRAHDAGTLAAGRGASVRTFDPDEVDPVVVGDDDETVGRDVRDEVGEVARDESLDALDRVTSKLAGAERREGQREMAGAVAAALALHRHLVVEAGTGIGKSLGYLVPVAISGRRTVVATATKALQDQLLESEIPALARAGFPVHAAVLKGRQNYLCRKRLSEVGDPGAPRLDLGDEEPAGVAAQLRRIARWAASTSTGERDALGFEADQRAWSRVSMPAEECPGADRCEFGATCFAEGAKQRAQAADVVIVNAALYGAHLSTGRTLLPPHEVVVFDEAHELDHHLTRSLGLEISATRLRVVAALARSSGIAGAVATDLAGLAERLGGRLGERVDHGPIVGLDDATRAILDDVARSVEQLVAALDDAAARGGDQHRRLSARGAVIHLRGDLVRLRDPGGDDLVFVEGTERAATLVRAPVEVGPLLASLWGEVTAVLCSATVPGGLEDRLGLPAASRRRVEYPSPFDYRAHSLLYVPAHLPERRDPACEPAMVDELAALVEAAGGRTLALFTSRRALEAVGRAVRERVDTPVLLQGERSRAVVLDEFRRDEATSLFATMGFWQGVDVPGRTLTLLVVDRLPFGRPDDPMLEARRERAGDAAFWSVDVPRASMLLAQGVGRLIRTSEDRGVVCVLDTRLATATYRSALLARLPPMRRTTSRADAVAFLTEATGTPAVRVAARPGADTTHPVG
jgi:ATP-dependent DNA helicase DinG